MRIESALPLATARRRLANSSKVLERTPFHTMYLRARVSDASVLLAIEGRNYRYLEFEGSLSPAAGGSSLVGTVRLSRIPRFILSAWFGWLVAGGLYFIHEVLTQPPDRDTTTTVAMVVVFGVIWVGFGVFAWLLSRRVFARSSDLIVAALRTALTEPPF